jgi:CRISPR/Cas system-associated exonuclease Cas4 (RecB family)
VKALVFSTFRQVREYVAAHDDTLLPKLYTMEEFLSRCVVVPGRVFVDEASRVLYLYRAIEKIDISKLGFDRNFLSFVRNSEFVFRFFEELHAERVSLQALRGADVYADFEDHLAVLEAIYDAYAGLLEEEGLVDRITVKEFRLNENFLAQLDEIEIGVDGYLSRFELEVLERIERPVRLSFVTTPFNRKLTERLGLEDRVAVHRRVRWRLGAEEVEEQAPVARVSPSAIETAAFEERIDQVAFVLKKIEEFVADGADPAKVAVVLPDESFADYLRLFDERKNFNYAMGIPFAQSRYYRLLADLYDALSGRSESAKEKMEGHPVKEAFAKVKDFGGFLAFLEGLECDARELKAIDEVRYAFASYAPLLAHASPLQLLHTWLQRLEPLHIDDVGGGKVTVMGVLESRGMRFDGVVLVDFNEDTVPKVGEKDIFLDSRVRAGAGMPTRRDKENLQKHYYYRLLQSSDRAAACWVRNEESLPSRFLAELGFGEKEPEGARYRPLIAPVTAPPRLYEEVPEGKNPFLSERRLTPTKLRDWLECPRRFHYRYLLKIGREGEEKEKAAGTLIHEALEAAARAKSGFSSAEEYFGFVVDHLYRNVNGVLQKFDISLLWEERLRDFCRLDFERLAGSEQAAVEEWRSVEFGGFMLSAKIDRVDVTDREVRLIDYKTSRNLDRTLRDENDYQLLFYRLWAESEFPDRRIDAFYADLYRGREERRDLEGERARLQKVLEEIGGRAEVSYTMTQEREKCTHCPYRHACGRG